MRPGRQASFAIRVPYTICLLRFCRLREIVSPNTHGEVNAFPKTIVPGHSRTPPTRTPTTQFHRPGPKSAGALAAQDVGGARQRRRDQHALPAVRREMPRLARQQTHAAGGARFRRTPRDAARCRVGRRAPPYAEGRLAVRRLRQAVLSVCGVTPTTQSRRGVPSRGSDSESTPSSRYTLASAPAALAQSAERLTRNEKVVGSIPTGGSTQNPRSEVGS